MNSKDILNSFQSPATAYEITLTEISKSQNSKDEKIYKVFEVLDEIVPNLGVYSSIMKIVRKQLFDAVFSDEFTANSSSESQDAIQRISYFSKYKVLTVKRDDKYEALSADFKRKEEELANKVTELNEREAKIESLNQEISNLNRNKIKLNTELKSKDLEIKSFEGKILNIEQLYGQKVQILEHKIDDMNHKVNEGNELISELSNYKNSYDQIHTVFSPAYTDKSGVIDKKNVGSTRKNQIIVDILNAKKLEEQIFTLINVATEEYDTFLEKQNDFLLQKMKTSELMEESYVNSFNNLSSSQIEKPFLSSMEKSMLSKQMETERLNYAESIAELKNQYDLTVQHRQSLEEKLYLLEADRETTEFIKRQKAKAAVNAANGSHTNSTTSLQGLEEHYEPIRKGADRDMFAVQDRVFSRFAASMMTGFNGAIWHEFPGVKFCSNCGDKTLICPHKMPVGETVFEVPAGTRFLKFSRPRLQYNQFMIKRSLDLFKKSDSKFQQSSTTIVLTNYKAQYPQDIVQYQSRESLSILNEGNPEIGMVFEKMHNFQRVWYDYNQKTSYKRQVARPFTYERTISIFQQFLAYLHNKELTSDQPPKDIVNTLYEYFEYRYEIEEIKFASIFDFYSSIHVYAARSMFIEIFCNVLIGNLDRSVLNYLLYMAEIIERVEWQENDDAKIFFGIIYPFCDNDELDILALDYTSYSENKINKKLVLEFIMTQIMKRKEMNINEVEFRLSNVLVQEKDYMTEVEFCKTMEQMFFVADEKHSQVAYHTSLAHAAWDNLDVVPISKLAQIGAYFYLIQLMNDMTQSISQLVNETRSQIREKEMADGLINTKPDQKTEFEDEFIKISEIDELAQAILK